MSKIRVDSESGIGSGELRKVEADGMEILLVNVNGNYFAVDDTCTHAGASLSEGSLEGSTVTCGWHGAQFDCESGSLAKFPAKIRDLKSYRVTVESGDVFIEV
jgi:nitrite reductase/ring-hydroxylating ferredoxin subunit